MELELVSYRRNETIPARDYMTKKKHVKFFDRETAAAMVCVGRLLKGRMLPTNTPFYYAKGAVEHEEYGLEDIAAGSATAEGAFDHEGFIKVGMANVSPLTHSKVMYNMTLSFLSIELGLTGDNAVIYRSASGLLLQTYHAPVYPGIPILIGAGRVNKEGTVESGFALVTQGNLLQAKRARDKVAHDDAMELFLHWNRVQRERGQGPHKAGVLEASL